MNKLNNIIYTLLILPFNIYRINHLYSLNQTYSITPEVCNSLISLQHNIFKPWAHGLIHQLVLMTQFIKNIPLFLAVITILRSESLIMKSVSGSKLLIS